MSLLRQINKTEKHLVLITKEIIAIFNVLQKFASNDPYHRVSLSDELKLDEGDFRPPSLGLFFDKNIPKLHIMDAPSYFSPDYLRVIGTLFEPRNKAIIYQLNNTNIPLFS